MYSLYNIRDPLISMLFNVMQCFTLLEIGYFTLNAARILHATIMTRHIPKRIFLKNSSFPETHHLLQSRVSRHVNIPSFSIEMPNI